MARQPSWIEIPELGKKLPRTTTILKYIPKEWMGPWAAKITAQYMIDKYLGPISSGFMEAKELETLNLEGIYTKSKSYYSEITERAADIGTKVHNTIEKFLKAKDGEEIEYEKDIEKPFKAFLKWWNDNNIEPFMVETRIWSVFSGGYTGKLDLVGLYNEKLFIIDFKSSKDFYVPEHPLQLASYRFAFEERYYDLLKEQDINVEGMGILRLDKEDGLPYWREYGNYDLWRDSFLSLTEFFHKLQVAIKAKN